MQNDPNTPPTDPLQPAAPAAGSPVDAGAPAQQVPPPSAEQFPPAPAYSQDPAAHPPQAGYPGSAYGYAVDPQTEQPVAGAPQQAPPPGGAYPGQPQYPGAQYSQPQQPYGQPQQQPYGQPGSYPPGAYDPQSGAYQAQPGAYAPPQPGYYQAPTAPPGVPLPGTYAPPGTTPPGAAPQQQGPFLGYARSEDWDRFTEEFSKIRFDQVVPLGAWLKDKPWNLVWVRWFVIYAIFPFIMLANPNALVLENAAWGFGVYFAFMWLIVLTLCIKPERLDLPLIGLIAGFTIIIGIPVVLLLQRFPIISSLYAGTKSQNVILQLIGYTFGVGFLEEVCKAAPLMIFAYKKKQGYRPLTFAYLGVISGLAFGVKEAVGYSSNVYPEIVQRLGLAGLGIFITAQLIRLISLPLLHACWSGIVGYFIGLASMHTTAPRALLVTGLVIAMVMHGVYDTFANGWTGAILASLTVLIFLSYVRSGDVMSKEILAQEVGATPEAAHEAAVAAPG